MSKYSLLNTLLSQTDSLHIHKVLQNATTEVIKYLQNKNRSCLDALKFLHLVVEFTSDTCLAEEQKHVSDEDEGVLRCAEYYQQLRTIVDDVCLRILTGVDVINIHEEKREELETACELLCLCLKPLDEAETVKLLGKCVATLREYPLFLTGVVEAEEKTLSADVAVELLKYLLDFIAKSDAHHENADIKAELRSLEDSLFLILRCCHEKLAALILAVLVPKFVELVGDSQRSSLRATLWKCTQQFFIYSFQDSVSDDNGVGYLILCNAVDNLQSWSHNSGDDDANVKFFCESNVFWQIVQSGLVHQNPLNRKRAIFILKRVLLELETKPICVNCAFFWWHTDENEKLIKLWSSYVLIMETLEERQVHVIKPILPRIDLLVSAAKTRGDSNGAWYLHSSWVTSIYHRMFFHESKFVKQTGVMKTLKYDFTKEELLDQGQTQFILYPLLSALNDPALYVRSTSELRGLCPNLAQALNEFIRSCKEKLETVEHQANFLSCFLTQMKPQTWCSVSLLYVSQALANLPPTRVWNLHSLNDLRHLVSSALTTQEVFIRGAIQCFLLEALLQLIDVNDVSFCAFCDILSPFKNEESLRRGYGLWLHLTSWLKCNVKDDLASDAKSSFNKESAVSFVQIMLEDVLRPGKSNHDALLVDSAVVEKSARLLVMFLDAEIVISENMDSRFDIHSLLQPVMDLVKTMHARPYLCLSTVDHSLQLILAILEEIQYSSETEGNDDKVRISFYTYLQSCIEEIIMFVTQNVPATIIQMQDLDRLELYLRLLDMISRVKIYQPIVIKYTIAFTEVCCNVFLVDSTPKATAVQRFAAAKGLALVVEFFLSVLHGDFKDTLFPAAQSIIKLVEGRLKTRTLSDPLKKEDLLSGESGFQNSRWGRTVSEYIGSNWKCLSLLLGVSTGVVDHVSVAQQGLLAMELSADVLPAIGSCLKFILPQLLESNEDLFLEVLDCMWKVCFEKRKTEAFWLGMKAFVQMSFQPILLQHSKAYLLKKYSDEAFQLSDSCPNIFRMLVFHCYEMWIKDRKPPLCQHLQLLVDALLFGPVHRKDQRASNEAAAYISSLQEKCSVNKLLESNHLDDVMVRVCSLTLVLRLSHENAEDQRLVSNLLDRLLEEDIRTTSSRARYFGNSLIHRVKNRVWQTILILEPLLSEEKLMELLPIVYAELVKEGAQPSVRMSQEWLAVLIMMRIPTVRGNLWKAMQDASDTRIGSVGSFLAIISHLGKVIESAAQEDFIMAAIPYVLPWCMAQNFNTRVTAQVAFHQLWCIAEEKDLSSVLRAYSSVQACIIFTVDSRNATKNTHKLLEDFYYGVFHCKNHYSLETIFYEFPRILQLTDEEWIPSSLFLQKKSKVLQDFAVPILNPDNELASCEPATWMAKAVISDEMEDEGSAKMSGNVQKKLIPWKQLIAEQGFLLDIVPTKHAHEGLIVVASLIDRAPNLGGLCRTCEIFGASEYVLGSLKYTEDKQFQNLSVSAEKWIPISEVKCHQIKDYLLRMRKKGYILVGAEQTAYSKQLQNFEFPKKTLLLLGNEKEGIPVEFIQLLDVCLEIPQYGVIRSLNVHVSGAVIITCCLG